MKRSLIALLMVLFLLPDASGGTPQKKRSSKRPKAVAAEKELVDRDADADADKDRPKRGPNAKKDKKASSSGHDEEPSMPGGPIPATRPIELQLKRGASKKFDVRALPARRPHRRERQELEPPDHTPVEIERERGEELRSSNIPGAQPVANAPAPPPNIVFEGLDREFWGAGSPPDTTGDVGPNYYIQGVNSSVGIYDKTGNQVAAFTFDTLMSQGNFGNLCDTENFGDPVILYDTFEDRWILTDFAFLTDGGGNPLGPAYQCFAVSQTSNPVTGGWHFYSIQSADFLDDYEKLGVWTDGIYMSANMFGFGPGGTFQTARAWAFNKFQMYAGSPTVQVVAFNIPGGDFAVMPSNARLQTGTPPPGRPNLFISTWQFLNGLTVYKFHVDWASPSLSTFTGPDVPIAATSWPNATVANAPQPGTAQLLDVLQIRAMIQNQYTNFGGVESLWIPHTVRRANTTGFAAPRWYQVDVSGGTVNPNVAQAATWDPDGANVMHRFMPSLALDRAGNLAMGYSISNATTMFPSIAYAGRLAGDPINTFSQTETMMFTGTASQTSSARWGDYTTMSLDPDGCTFWYTNEYANPADQTFAKRWKTKIGSFAYPSCTPVGAGGTITGTVTETPGGTPISGATVSLGARTTTTNGSGIYSFLNIPAGTYPTISATKPGYSTASATSIAVTDGGTTIQDFALSLAPTSACLTDTTQADFQTADLTSVDVLTTPGDVKLNNVATDQQNTAGTTTGTGFGTPNWTGQTFIPSVTGQLLRVETTIFCNGCGATPPNLTLSVRATSGGLPTGADLASVTINGSNYGSGSTTTVMSTFPTPATLTAGTQYALVMRPVSAPAGSGYFWIRSSPSTYASGSRVLSADSGGSWSADTTRDYNFKAVMAGPYSPTSGNLVSNTKDSNPLGGLTAIWSNLTWNGSTPANTTLQFQVAGSNNVNGPFNFVGPDGTAGTFYTTSPSTLDTVYNLRYVKYKAYLATTNNANTPVLSDVTLCVNNVDCSGVAATITPAPTSVCDNSTGNTASGPAGMTSYSWSITNGTITSATNTQAITYTAGASGNVQLTLSVVAPSGCKASSNVNVPILITPAQPTITPSGATTFCAGGSVTLTSDAASGNQWFLNGNPIGGETGTQLVVSASGSYTVVASNGACASPASSAVVVTVNPLPATPTITPSGPTTFCTGGSVTLTSSAASGNQWYLDGNPIGGETNTTLVVSASGDYTVVTTDGNSCSSSPSATTTVTVNPIPSTPTITPSGPTTFCAGGSVTLTSSAASGNQWYLNGNPIGGETGQQYVATGSGSYTVVVTASGCSSPASSATVVTVNPLPSTPTITPSGPTTFCQGGSVTLTSSAASGNQWYLNGSPIGGETGTQLVVTATGNYTVTTTDGNSCTSAASATTSVTVNPIPNTPIVTPSGPTTFCAGGSVTLTSSATSGNQWLLNGNPIGGQTGQQLVVTASGNYTVTVTENGCTSPASSTTTVTVNPLPSTPTITPSGPTTFCTGGSVTLTSSAASGNQWFLNGNPIGGQTGQQLVVSASGSYTVTTTDGNSCTSNASAATVVTVNPIPATPTVTPSGPTTFCAGGSVTLTSSSATGNQWFLNGNPIGGQTGQQLVVTASGNYTVVVTQSGCSSPASATTTVTVNPIPSTPTITPSGPTTFCAGGSVTLTSSSATGNQWYLNGNPIGGQTGQQLVASVAGDYTVVVTTSGCASAPSAVTTVTVNPIPNATITAPASVVAGSTGNAASVANAGVGATYSWSITGGSITAGAGTANITFSAAGVGTLTLNVTVSKSGCSDSKSANVTVTPAGPTVTVTSVTPSSGPSLGGTNVTITGSGFNPSPTVTFGGTAATNVVRVNSTTITAKTPAHAAGAVNVTVTNTNATNGTLTNGFTYTAVNFDANGDTTVDPSDIFYLINYLFLGGPAPAGTAGPVLSGDANGDGVVDPSDIFYAVFYLFGNGPAPHVATPGGIATTVKADPVAGQLSLGRATLRNGRWVVPVIATIDRDSAVPQALSLRVRFDGAAQNVAIRRAGSLEPVFEVSRGGDDAMSYLVAFGSPFTLDATRSAVIAEIELSAAGPVRLELDSSVTALVDATGSRSATAGNGKLRTSGTIVGREAASPSNSRSNQQ